jgi:hypothetical protein
MLLALCKILLWREFFGKSGVQVLMPLIKLIDIFKTDVFAPLPCKRFHGKGNLNAMAGFLMCLGAIFRGIWEARKGAIFSLFCLALPPSPLWTPRREAP